MANTEIGTFSAAVDECIARSGRADKKNDIISYLRQSVLECQVLKLFRQDYVEDQLTATSDPYVWTAPVNLRALDIVSYPNILDPQNNPVYPVYMEPGKGQRRLDYFFYRSGDSYVFTGHDRIGIGSQPINIAYYTFMDRLQYFDAGSRPARFYVETLSWEYLTAVTPTEKAAAQAQVTNWLIFTWYEAIIEGALAKIFKLVGDGRAVSSFALFSSFKNDLKAGSGLASTGRALPT